MKLSVYNINGTDTGKTIELKPEIFGLEPNTHAIYLDVKQHLANKRHGTHKSKERADISRTTKKLKKQKGTGGARAGSMKSPLFIGGGRVFGPRPHDYDFKVNKKVKSLARISALSVKALESKIMLVEDFNFDTPKTKQFLQLKEKLKINKKLLLILPEQNNNVYLSSRNLEGNKVVTVSDLNTYDILNASTVLFSEKSLTMLQENA